MALDQEILIKSNSTDAAAVPSSLKPKEVAANLLDRSLFGHNGTSVFRFYEHSEKYFNEFGSANNALKLGGFLPTYFQQALVSGLNIKTINGQSVLGEGDIEISGGGDTENLVTKEEVIEGEEVIAAALNNLNTRINDNKKLVEEIFSTKKEVADNIAYVIGEIVKNEEVIAVALNDLDNRIKDIIARFEACNTY